MRNVEVYFPRFTIETDYNLIPPHQELGITDVFEMDANLSRIIEYPPVYITEFIHKAFVEVNEEGTEAAAVTMVKAVPISAPPPKAYEFRADHPFLYLIIDSQKRTILFLGRVMKPEGSLPPNGTKPNRPPSLRNEMLKEMKRIRNKFKK
jgi:serpin B